jgi:hypothetical protein
MKLVEAFGIMPMVSGSITAVRFFSEHPTLKMDNVGLTTAVALKSVN